MKRITARVATTAAAVAGFGVIGAGVASAEEAPYWLLPGVDAGALVGPIANLPAEALAPVYSLISLITG
ncbi:hypothetical protein BJF85_10825 [Saccharomonospora sp. CUA-673]|uniref:hypothetical protein n=1 Tax=Saccharomonospora sp. CUA-673 TaxID=1904969 RepID=UPI000965D75D|nr:hypothetical protein [Saccharomonospora sp. CUA-673]OLT48952.1 hypothetical protein BJF85_10825 [Saccharomonospora sp. CUA-673]